MWGEEEWPIRGGGYLKKGIRNFDHVNKKGKCLRPCLIIQRGPGNCRKRFKGGMI